MTTPIIEKGGIVNLAKETVQPAGSQKFYFGAGWDKTGGGTDLDLMAALLVDGKVVDLAYFGQKTLPGAKLSDDNRSGEGAGDDEFLIIDVDNLPSNVNGIAIGIAVYSGDDFASVANPHIRGCDGASATDTQIFDFPIKDTAFANDTVLHAATLQKGGAGWMLKAIGTFHAKGKGTDAVNGFQGLFA